MKTIIGKYWRSGDLAAIGLVALAVLVVFSEPLLTGDAVQASDTSLGAVHYSMTHQKHPPFTLLGDWREDVLLGRPGQPGLLVPRHLARIVFPDAKWFINMLYFLETLLLGLALYAWLRVRRFTPVVAAGAGIALALAGHSFTMISAGHLGKFGMFPYLVLALFCLDAAIGGAAFVLFPVAGLCLAFAMAHQPDVTTMTGLLIAAFCAFRAARVLVRDFAWPRAWRVGGGLAVAVAAALLIAAPTMFSQVRANVTGVTRGAGRGPQEQWEWATQWSLPPEDTLEFVAPTVFGIKSGDPRGPYWGRQGRSAGWEETQQGFRNFRQEGQYMSALVFVFAILGAVLAFGRREWLPERLRHWRPEMRFWAVAALAAWLLALGKYAPLYRLFFSLPTMSAMRNPVKFLYAFEICVVMLFAFGLQAFTARLMLRQEPASAPAPAKGAAAKQNAGRKKRR